MMAEMKELSTSKELEELANKKAVLEAESHSLKEEQQNLEERIRVLEEKIVVEELKNGNRTRHDAVSRLKLKMDELEQRLEEVTKTQVTEPTSEAPEIAEADEPKEEAAVGITGAAVEEPEEDVVTVAPLESPMRTEGEKGSEDLKRQQEKKKKKFF
jgi:predicted nuclease with TOPRIM domain